MLAAVCASEEPPTTAYVPIEMWSTGTLSPSTLISEAGGTHALYCNYDLSMNEEISEMTVIWYKHLDADTKVSVWNVGYNLVTLWNRKDIPPEYTSVIQTIFKGASPGMKQDPPKLHSGHSLTIKKADLDDAGSYSCEATVIYYEGSVEHINTSASSFIVNGE